MPSTSERGPGGGWAVALPAAAVGFAAQTVQVVLLREALRLFHGSELAWGLVLAAWLAGAGLGSFAAPRLFRRLRPGSALAAAALLAALSGGAVVALFRFAPVVWQLPAGGLLSLSTASLTALAGVAPAFFVGAQFPLLLRRLEARAAYAIEAAGSLIAGAALAFALLRHVDPLSLLAGSAALVSLAAATWKPRRVAIAGITLAAAAAVGSVADRRLDARAWEAVDPQLHVAGRAQSPYGPAVAIEYAGDVTIYQSGRKRMSLPDRGEAAPAVHLILGQVEKPAHVLLAGGSAAGWLREALRHPLERVVVLEPDAELDELALRFAGPRDVAAREDPRVELRRDDARAFLRSTSERFDVLILNAGDPTVVATNRYYTREFLAVARSRLAPGGVLAVGPVVSYVGPPIDEILARNRSLYATLRDAFPHVAATPGRSAYLLARADAAVTFAPARVPDDVDMSWITEPFAVEAIAYELRTGRPYDPLRPGDATEDLSAPRNTDAHPIAALGSDLAWGAAEGDPVRVGLAAAVRAAGAWLALAALLPLAWLPWRSARAAAGATVFATGWCAMAAPVLLILAFQNAAGTIYEHVALLVAAFMAGASVGAIGLARFRGTVAIGLVAVTAWIGLAFALLSSLPVAGAFVALPLLAAACGLLGGGVFAQVIARTPEASPARLYGWDLLGGAAGAIFTTAFLLPAIGAAGAALVPAGALAIAAAAPLRGTTRGRSRDGLMT